jgi:hypothetical protein
LHVLVYESVLRDNDQLQLAHAYWVVPLPDVWWQSNANADSDSYADSYSDANTYTDANADTYSNPNADSDAATNTERAVESRWNWSIADADQPLVDG